MIIEDERDLNAPIEVVREAPPPEVEIAVDDIPVFSNFLLGIDKSRIKKLTSHFENALIDHLWEEYTNSDA